MIQSGYLVLADISGFTPFVASTELDHAQVLLAKVFETLRRSLEPPLRFAELEGDALFMFVPERHMQRGETLLELIERTYLMFRDLQLMASRGLACDCQACRAIPLLDLKFITHFGEYILQEVAGAAKPFGSSVNLAHRLLKNTVEQETSWRAYALFTAEAIARMCVRPAGVHVSRATYEHLGEFDTHSLNLRSRYEELVAERRAFVGDGDAHFTIRTELPLPPPRVWELLNEPNLRSQWEANSDWSARQRPAGRTAPGADNHCANSDFIEEVLDWRPFDYFTVRLSRGMFRFVVTGQLEEREQSTALRWSIRMEGGAPNSMRGAMCRFFAKRLVQVDARFERLQALAGRVAEDPATAWEGARR